MRPAFLFDPTEVERRLVALPALATELRPRQEPPSQAFTAWHKSERQIYRLLASADDDRLATTLARIDHWLGRGFGGAAIRARGRENFRAALAELEVADHFEARRFSITGLDATRAEATTADMRVVGDDLTAVVEVYCPVEWQGLDFFRLDAWDTLRQLDLPYDYVFSFQVAQLHMLDEQHRYRPLHPETLTRGLDTADKREALLGPLFNAAVAQLSEARDVTVTREVDELNIKIMTELEGVQRVATFHPREGVWGLGAIGGYRPEIIFDEVVGRAKAKAARRQATRTDDALAVLVVDTSRLPLESELSHPTYRDMFASSLSRHFPPSSDIPLDVLAFCRSRGWQQELVTYYALHDPARVDQSTSEALLGPLTDAVDAG